MIFGARGKRISRTPDKGVFFRVCWVFSPLVYAFSKELDKLCLSQSHIKTEIIIGVLFKYIYSYGFIVSFETAVFTHALIIYTPNTRHTSSHTHIHTQDTGRSQYSHSLAVAHMLTDCFVFNPFLWMSDTKMKLPTQFIIVNERLFLCIYFDWIVTIETHFDCRFDESVWSLLVLLL